MSGIAAAALQLQGIHKAFGSFVALQSVDLTIERGELVCFVGPSGCGKTTLLRIIAGLEAQTRGRVIQDGRDVSTAPPAARNITTRVAGTWESGHRAVPVALPDANKDNAYLVCTTCHTPHTMYTFSGRVKNQASQGTYPSYFFIAAPYNPGSNPMATQASSATQFSRQCHFTGAGGSNEGSGIMGVTTAF